mgnify:CR=1 FL=1
MANYTQQHLADTLKALMHEHPLDTITVQQLVARARVNRKTFYYHFHGIADLLGWMYTDAFERVSPAAESNLFTWQRLMDQAMELMRAEAFYLRAITDSGYGPAFWAQMQRLYERSTDRFVTSVIALYEQQHQTQVASTCGGTMRARSGACSRAGFSRACRSRTRSLSASCSGSRARISMRSLA